MSSGNSLFYLMMLMGPLLCVSSSSWVICWVGIELTFLGLIPVLSSEMTFFSLSKESSMKYFCIQALGSGILFVGGLLAYIFYNNLGILVDVIFFSSLLIKLGIFPAHFWVPSVVSGLGYFPLLLLLTWQKVPPLFLMINFLKDYSSLSEVLLVLGGLSAIVGAGIGLNQSKVLPMLGASSITHGGWLMVGISYGCVWMYFLLYTLSLSFFLIFMSAGKNMISGLGLLSLSGLPPFTMFVGKWVVLKFALLTSYSYWLVLLPVIGSVLSLFYYLKFTYSFYLEEENNQMNNWSYFISLSAFMLMGSYFLWVY